MADGCVFIPVGGVMNAYLQIAPHGLLPFGLGAGQLLPQHLLPHVDGLQRLLDVEEVLLQKKDSSRWFSWSGSWGWGQNWLWRHRRGHGGHVLLCG